MIRRSPVHDDNVSTTYTPLSIKRKFHIFENDPLIVSPPTYYLYETSKIAILAKELTTSLTQKAHTIYNKGKRLSAFYSKLDKCYIKIAAPVIYFELKIPRSLLFFYIFLCPIYINKL